MKKQIKYSIQFFLCFLISVQTFSQTETFDIITYNPPKDWKKDIKQGVINYTNVNSTTGAFCVIALYASSASSGDAQKDFNKEWKELVITPFKAEANPKTETGTTPDGWKTIGGASLVKVDGVDVYVILSVYSGFGKTVSIRTSINDQSYTTQIDALFATIKLDKTKTVTVNNNKAKTEQTAGNGKFGLMMYSAPPGWSEQIFSDGVVFKPSDLPAGDLLAVQIMQPLNF